MFLSQEKTSNLSFICFPHTLKDLGGYVVFYAVLIFLENPKLPYEEYLLF